MKNSAVLSVILLLHVINISRAGIVVYSNDFENQLTTGLSGYVSVQPTQGLATYGCGSYFLHNSTGGWSSGQMGIPGSATTLTLTNLPEHTALKLDFLLAVVDSWDGTHSNGPDRFNVTVDGQSVFAYYMENISGSHATQNLPGWQSFILAEGSLCKNPGWSDSLYNTGLFAAFQSIAHTSNIVTIQWWADGAGWQGGGIYGENDESWGIDNLTITAIPEPATILLLGCGGFILQKRKK